MTAIEAMTLLEGTGVSGPGLQTYIADERAAGRSDAEIKNELLNSFAAANPCNVKGVLKCSEQVIDEVLAHSQVRRTTWWEKHWKTVGVMSVGVLGLFWFWSRRG